MPPSQITRATMHACALSATSNLIAQYLDARAAHAPLSLDVLQLLRFVVFTALTAPPNHHWQMLLERTFPSYHAAPGVSPAAGAMADLELGEKRSDDGGGDNPTLAAADGPSSSSAAAAAAAEPKKRLNIRHTLYKFFIDCITLGALLNTTAFFVLMGILKGQPLGTIAHNVVYETWGVIWLSYKIWPVASLISFSFVPAHWRVVWLSGAGLIYGVCLSFVGQRT
jgi:hypothetical protein